MNRDGRGDVRQESGVADGSGGVARREDADVEPFRREVFSEAEGAHDRDAAGRRKRVSHQEEAGGVGAVSGRPIILGGAIR